MSALAPYVRILGRGPARSRALTRDEAREAMGLILSGAAAPEAVGALLMLLRYRGETAPEIAGFVEAMRLRLPAGWSRLGPALDWPSLAAGRSRGAPLFLLAARLVARAGYRVLLHGYNSHQSGPADVRAALPACGIRSVTSPDEAAAMLARDGIVYVPLDILLPEALALLRLRDVLGLRSGVNTVLRMLNPGDARASVQGVFHPSYRDLQADTAACLGRDTLTIIKGGGGEFERHPSKSCLPFGLREGKGIDAVAAPLFDGTRRLHTDDSPVPALADLWSGAQRDAFAEAVIIGTAGLALWTLGAAATTAQGDVLARALWEDRHGAALDAPATATATPATPGPATKTATKTTAKTATKTTAVQELMP